MQTLVIGGGISGLACAWRLKQLGADVTLAEQTERPGGVISTVQKDGFRFESGPQSFLATPALLELIASVGLEEQLSRADPRAPRYVLHGGKLQAAPLRPPEILTTSLLSRRTKLRLVSEPFRRSRPPERDESLAAFVRRKFGDDLLENLAAPFVSGIYAGDPERLSLRAAFPQVHQWEKEYGSVLRGAMKSRPPKGGPRASPCSFREGMASMPATLAERLGEVWQPGVHVESIRRAKANGHSTFEVRIQQRGRSETLSPEAVVLATPADTAGKLLASFSSRLHEKLTGIEYAPVAVVCGGYRRQEIAHSLKGFGFLVPRKEGRRILGTVWSSSLFPERAPQEMVALASFAGGATDARLLDLGDEEIAGIVESELSGILGITGSPVTRLVSRQARAIPQYNLGHTDRIREIHNELERFPGLFLAGNFLDGPAIGACVEQAWQIAARVRHYLEATS